MSSSALIRRHIAAFNERDEAREPWSSDAQMVAPGGSVEGREDVLGFLRVFHEAFPDGSLNLTTLIGDGDTLAGEGTFTGTHTGVLRSPAGDVGPTGRSVSFRWAAIYEVREAELVSEHLFFDQMDLLGQLGLLPD